MEETIHLGGTPCFFIKNKKKAIILIYEIWGMNEHTKDIARRLHKEGYTVLAPDILADTGVLGLIQPSIMGELQDPAKRSEAQKKFRQALAPMQSPDFGKNMIEKLKASFQFLEQQGMDIAVLGFCFGGTYSFALAANEPVKACIAFYGQPPSSPEKIHCPVLALYGEKDENLINGLPALKQAMKDKDFTAKVYKNTGHAFFNDTNAFTYNKDAANDSWKATLAFLKKHLG